MKRKLIITMMLAVLTVVSAEAKKYKVAVAMPKAQQAQFERTANWALQTIAAGQTGSGVEPTFMLCALHAFLLHKTISRHRQAGYALSVPRTPDRPCFSHQT